MNRNQHTLTWLLLLLLTLPSSIYAKRTWKIIEHNNITIYSCASDSKTERVFEEIKMFEGGVRTVFDGRIKELKWPLRVVVCSEDKSFRELAHLRDKGQRDLAGYYQRGASYDLIVIKGNAKPKALRSIMYHEMGHRLLEDFGKMPLWLDEGYAQVFERFEAKKGVLNFGLADEMGCWVICNEGILPLERMFMVHHSSKEYRDPKLSSKFYATSWGFVHMCMYGVKRDFKDGFVKWVAALKKQPPSEALFQQCLGCSYEEMERYIRSYARNGKYQYSKFDIASQIVIPEVSIRKSNDFENFYYKGCVLGHSKRYQEARNSLVGSEQFLEPLQEGVENSDQKFWAKLYAAYASVALYENEHELAKKYAATAIQLGSKDYATQVLYAENILGLGEGYSIHYDLHKDELRTLFQILNSTMAIRRNDKRVHRIHANIWNRTDRSPRESHKAALIHACSLFPEDSYLLKEIARVFEKNNEYGPAIEILKYMMNNSSNEELKSQTATRIEELEGRRNSA